MHACSLCIECSDAGFDAQCDFGQRRINPPADKSAIIAADESTLPFDRLQGIQAKANKKVMEISTGTDTM